jgi:RNA-directed DNA polymerase
VNVNTFVSFKTITDAVTNLDAASEIEALIQKKGGSRDLFRKSWICLHGKSNSKRDSVTLLSEIGCFISFNLAFHIRLLLLAIEGGRLTFDALYRVIRDSKGRDLEIPLPLLDSAQTAFKKYLPNVLKVHPSAHAYLPKRSQFTNAKPHVGKALVATLDLKSFFHSVTFEMIASAFKKGDCGEMSDEAIGLLCRMSSREGRLPVGVSTSPHIANSVMYPLDEQISFLCRKLCVDYTRFADDLTFSGEEDHVKDVASVATTLLRKSGFELNNSKTRFMRSTQRQIVTGVVVNARMSAPLEKRKQLRAMYHKLQSGGVPFEGKRIISDSSLGAKLGHVGKLHPSWVLRLKGKPPRDA